MNIRKILIANRGEIALRIMRSARKMGIRCGVIYTTNEITSLFVRESDDAFCLGSGTLHDTYLNIPKIIQIARDNGFDAIHPGYGFLSENADFSQACFDAGIVFIGPDPNNIRLMSNKIESRKFVEHIGVPLLSSVSAESTEELVKKAGSLEFPLVVKAAAGGGGKGMRVVTASDNLFLAIEAAKREAYSYFNDDQVYIEHYIEDPRHIEVQLIADKFGNIVHLYDRECSIQRRYQKIIEESPAVALSESTRTSMIDAALQIARKMHYTSAGTIEFLVDSSQKFYFLEMNTRIQVEHTVSEEITGVDIVREQIAIAADNALSFNQDDIASKGHAIECRVYAEDPFHHFLPAAGNILFYKEPKNSQVRIDSSIDGATEISTDFDPMIVKVIAHGSDRNDARKKLLASLNGFIIHGITTNLGYLQEVLDHPDFKLNHLSTSFCDQSIDSLTHSFHERLEKIPVEHAIAAYLFAWLSGPKKALNNQTIWENIGYWRNRMFVELKIQETVYKVRFRKIAGEVLAFSMNGGIEFQVSASVSGSKVLITSEADPVELYITITDKKADVTISGVTILISRLDFISLNEKTTMGRSDFSNQNEVFAPLYGKVLKVNVKPGDRVQKGDVLMIIESMKMENNILASQNGFVQLIHVATGDKVTGSELLVTLNGMELN
jgi:3-methylcrotonyl-CoA carboxylase alpha subunit